MEWIKYSPKGLKDNSDYKKYKEQLGLVSENGILICKSKLEFSELKMSTKNPLILPKTIGSPSL